MTDRPPASLYMGRTSHRREKPFVRAFSYPIAMIELDIDRLEQADAQSRLFSVERANAISFRAADHGPRAKGASLRVWAEERFAEAGVALESGRILLAAFPRVLGHGFSPLAVWFGYGPEGDLRGVIYEVHNTFGEAHAYVAPFKAGEKTEADKQFHVSPFMDVAGRYRFTVREPGDRLDLIIENIDEAGRSHVATITARRRAFSDTTLLRWLLRMPFSGLGVVLAIHWQALFIWLKGARYHDKPAQQANRTTLAGPPSAQLLSETAQRKRAMTRLDRMVVEVGPHSFDKLGDLPASFRIAAMIIARLKHGRIDFTFPDGRTLRFKGAEPGPEAEVIVIDPAFARAVLEKGDIGFAEAYMDGKFDTPDLAEVLRYFTTNFESAGKLAVGGALSHFVNSVRHFFRRNSKKGSKRNILAHYDLGNDFYARWTRSDDDLFFSALPPTRQQSRLRICKPHNSPNTAPSPTTSTSDPACRVLEIGSGWGGFAEVAAREFGADVVSVTISDAQFAYAKQRIAGRRPFRQGRHPAVRLSRHHRPVRRDRLDRDVRGRGREILGLSISASSPRC